jgi:hypothetical protein
VATSWAAKKEGLGSEAATQTRQLLEVMKEIHRDHDDLVLMKLDQDQQAFVMGVRVDTEPGGGRVVLVTLDVATSQPATYSRLYRSLQWLPSWVLDLPVFVEGQSGDLAVTSFSESDWKPPAAEFGTSKILCADVLTESG